MRKILTPLIIYSFLLAGCNFATASTLASQNHIQPLSNRQSNFTSNLKRTQKIKIASKTEPRSTLIPNNELPDGPFLPALASSKPVIISYIQMVDQSKGWGIGHQNISSDHILFTKDGGLTWSDSTPPEPDADTRKKAWAYFASDRLGWVIYQLQVGSLPTDDPYVWFTRDGGDTWNISRPLSTDGLESFFVPEGFAFVSASHGWLLVHVDAGMSHDYSYLYSTENGGISWERIVDPYGVGLQSLHNTGIAFADTLYGWVSKDNLGVMAGAFFESTTDGGLTWEDIFLPAPPELDWFEELSLCQTSAPTFTSIQTASLIVKCRLYGDEATSFSNWNLTYIYTSLDRGTTWHRAQLPAPVDSLLFLDTQTGWAFGREYYQTTDGGLSWVPVKRVSWDGQFSFVDELHGWAVATNEDATALVYTTDGGQTWQIIEPEME